MILHGLMNFNFYLIDIIYCISGVYAMFKGLLEGLSGVRVTGKTGKSG